MKNKIDYESYIEKVAEEFKKLIKKHSHNKAKEILRQKGYKFSNNALYAYLKKDEYGGFRNALKKYKTIVLSEDKINNIKKVATEFKKLTKKYTQSEAFKILRQKGYKFDEKLVYAYLKKDKYGGVEKALKRYFRKVQTEEKINYTKKVIQEFKKLSEEHSTSKAIKLLRQKGYKFDNNVIYDYLKKEEQRKARRYERYEQEEKRFKEYIKSLISEFNVSKNIKTIKELIKKSKIPKNQRKNIEYHLKRILELSEKREHRIKNLAKKVNELKQRFSKKQNEKKKSIGEAVIKLNPKMISEIYKKFKTYNRQIKHIDPEAYNIIMKHLKSSKYKLSNKTSKAKKIRYIEIMKQLIQNDYTVKRAFGTIIGIPERALGSL